MNPFCPLSTPEPMSPAGLVLKPGARGPLCAPARGDDAAGSWGERGSVDRVSVWAPGRERLSGQGECLSSREGRGRRLELAWSETAIYDLTRRLPPHPLLLLTSTQGDTPVSDRPHHGVYYCCHDCYCNRVVYKILVFIWWYVIIFILSNCLTVYYMNTFLYILDD